MHLQFYSICIEDIDFSPPTLKLNNIHEHGIQVKLLKKFGFPLVLIKLKISHAAVC